MTVALHWLRRVAILLASLVLLGGCSTGLHAKDKPIGELSEGESLVRQIHSSLPAMRETALRRIVERGNKDVVPALVQALRYSRVKHDIVHTLKRLTGADVAADWGAWMLWLEDRPDIKPFDGFDRYKADLMAGIDPNFRLFLQRGVAHEIRLEEIVWGGVVKDGIPALVNPKHIAPAEAAYLTPDELVFGVAINGDARAYPLRIMDWHEMFNDVVGGKPVALAYCTLCGSGILFDTSVPGRAEPFVFGSSGLLYRSNKLMYDTATNSLWNQFTGRPVVGALTGSGIELKILPVVITSWRDWVVRHPDTKVLSLDTGHVREYEPGRPYGRYFASEELMFPALVRDRRLKAKDYVFALRANGVEKAWALAAFEHSPVINDRIGSFDVVLVGDVKRRSVRAFRAGGRKFEPDPANARQLIAADGIWKIAENGLLGPGGARLDRLAGHIAYWFAWKGYKPDAPFASAPPPESD